MARLSPQVAQATRGAPADADHGSMITVGVAQYAPVLGDLPANVEKSVKAIRAAAQQGADLVILPELANSGYVFHSRAEARSWAERPEESPAMAAWCEEARTHALFLVAGFAERVDDVRLYNSALIIGPRGIVGTYRKTHLFYEEKLYFEQGNLGLPVFSLPFGRVGVLICYDLRFPEASRILALQGAELICVPTNWVNLITPEREWDAQGYCQANYVAMANAAMNQVFMACADRIGEERGVRFLGCSIIIDPQGWPLAGPASTDGEAVLTARVNLAEARRAKSRNALNHTWVDRRTDLYHPTLGYSPPAQA